MVADKKPDIVGYRKLKSSEIHLINDSKELEKTVQRFMKELDTDIIHLNHLSVAKQYLTTGFMWLNRAIAKPD